MDPYRLVGSLGSPYSLKLRAVLRYRHIPFRWVPKGSRWESDIPAVKVPVIPVLVRRPTDGGPPTADVDTTPLLRRLEEEHAGRSIRPRSPEARFLDALVEDYADEWVTKLMFHYRWAFEADVAFARRLLPLQAEVTLPSQRVAELAAAFGDRQLDRRELVGSTDAHGPLLEGSYRRLLDLLVDLLEGTPFLFGERPASADFALYGQLAQLTRVDPTSAAVAREHAPRVIAWVEWIDDLAWWEPAEDGWMPWEALVARLRPLLEEIGRTYAPFMAANGRALSAGEDEVRLTLSGHPYVQRAFRYQGKCLRALRTQREELPEEARRRVDEALAGTGNEVLFA
jgi:glutathione S-transferase